MFGGCPDSSAAMLMFKSVPQSERLSTIKLKRNPGVYTVKA